MKGRASGGINLIRVLKESWAGLLLAIALGLFACWIASFHEALSALVVGIILGMVVRTLMGDVPYFLPGLELAPKVFIPLGITLYGMNLQFNRLPEVPAIFWLQLLVGTVAIFLVAVFLGRLLRMKDRTSFLVATGTAICGASAIAITTPVVKGDSEDAGASLITITIFGLFGLLLYPLALTYFAFTKTQYAILCATTLHMTGLVRSAAMSMGESCLNLATVIKMARTVMIIPVVGFLWWYYHRKERVEKKAILLHIPWFLWAFIAMGLVTSFVPGLGPLVGVLKPWAKVFFTMALTSIGLTVDLKKMLNVGGAPLILGLACWIAAIGAFVVISYL
jgi:uncharacterized integral membrane protein (TIGR00698 family)